MRQTGCVDGDHRGGQRLVLVRLTAAQPLVGLGGWMGERKGEVREFSKLDVKLQCLMMQGCENMF